MTSLKKIINQFAVTEKHLGTSRETVDKTAMIAALEKVRKQNKGFFLISVCMVVAIFCVSLYATIKNLDKPDTIKATYAAMGISTIGVVFYMTRLWKEKTSIDMLLILARDMKPENINALLVILMNKLK